jgi:lysine 2,3-aminomutase
LNKAVRGAAAPLITSLEALPPALAASVSPDEAAYIAALRGTGGFPFRVSPFYASLAGPERTDPLRRQFFPDPREAAADPFALEDPLGEAQHRAAPRLIHQYRDRVLLLAGGACAGCCRYCFRRVWLSGFRAFIQPGELRPVLAYLGAHREVREILVSGGDPLGAPDAKLAGLFGKLREARPGAALRLCTRAPVTNPARLGPGLIRLLRRYRPLRMAIHLNHPRELAALVRAGLQACVGAGIPVLVQTVLLRGVNDNPETLETLFRDCLALGLTPYYLFQLDLAPGTAHFRLPLKQGLALYRELGARFARRPGEAPPAGAGPPDQGGGPALPAGLPVYAVDLPGGGGKIRLREDAIAGERQERGGKVYLLQGPDGKLWPYPADE